MTLVIDKDRDRIGTHVLIIGVGRYPYLLDGDAPERFEFHGGMGQLSSPPNSALQLANWFATNHKLPGKPLRTLQLLLSGTPNAFTTPAGQTMTVEPAMLANISQAVKLWRDFGDLHEENHLVFYFCGHGVSNGIDQSLLSEDFGSNKDDPFQHAVDFSRFHIGMRSCKAKWQCFFLDACQTVSQKYIDQFGSDSTGVAIIKRSVTSNLQKTEQPVLLACALGAKAYGDSSKASFFAQALLSAFKGAAALADPSGKWEINTAQLCGGLNAYLERILERKHGKEQVARTDNLTNPFSLHVLEGEPIVPVDIFCKDSDKTEDIAFSCVLGGAVVQSCQAGETSIWEIDLRPDKYDFLATNIHGDPSPPPRTGVMVYPPCRKVEFKCP